MNERIMELAKQCASEDHLVAHAWNYSKFAELIIRECIAQCDDSNSQEYIMTHFGMKPSDWSN